MLAPPPVGQFQQRDGVSQQAIRTDIAGEVALRHHQRGRIHPDLHHWRNDNMW